MPWHEPTPGHRGAKRLTAALQTYYAGTDLTRSHLEILFKDLCRTHHLPTPRVDQPIAGKHVEFLFAENRLIVETDSWRYHKTRRAFEDDRARDVLTTTAGYRTLRFTDRQLTRQPHAVANAIAAVLPTAAPRSLPGPWGEATTLRGGRSASCSSPRRWSASS